MLVASEWFHGMHDFNWFGEAVIWLNMLGAGASIVFNYFAMRYSTTAKWKYTFGAISALSWLYFFAYILLLFGPFDPVDWGLAVRGFTVVAWPIAWCGPALARLNYHPASPTAQQILKIVEDTLVSGEIFPTYDRQPENTLRDSDEHKIPEA